ncbi:MAG: 3-carboxymuconate cyclase [Paenibacillaceae bacterium]|jgi:6-phosphogluconolactonase|nr:3-carboxymuconate cyclase [Paenibacillaceae bacterium]
MNYQPEKKTVVFLGSYANAEELGIHACFFDEATGKLTVAAQIGGVKNPTFLDVDADNRILYSLAEETDQEGNRTGAAVSYRIHPETLQLEPISRERTTRGPACHLKLDATRQNLLTSSYQGGMAGISPVHEDGRIGPIAQEHQHSGASLLPVQSQARVHSVTLDRRNQFAVVCDLGLDKIVVYRLDADRHTLTLHGEAKVRPGSGPRHFAFHPHGPYGYVINELSSTITAFAYQENEGTLAEIQTVSTLPEHFRGENACAEIQVSPDGRFLYGSNRGHDSIAVFAVKDEDGTISPVDHVSTLGGHPRHFALSPDGRFLLAANRDGNNVVTFVRNPETGGLAFNGQQLELSQPVCVKFAQW